MNETLILEIIFWSALFMVFYTYLGYGIVLYALVRLKELFVKPVKRVLPPDSDLPEVTLFITAFNEEDVVDEKMENSLALDYPADKLRIVWVTDGSDDGTNDRLQTRWNGKVTVYFQPKRQGKTAAMTRGMTLVRTPLVVFTDANTMVNTRDEPHADPDSFRRLHVIIGDSNRSQWSTWMKLAVTHLVLCAIEDAFRHGVPSGFEQYAFADPAAANRTVSRFLDNPRAELTLESGESVSALGLQRRYYAAVKAFIETHVDALAGSLPATTIDTIMGEWSRVLDALERGTYDALADRVDWAAKKRLFDALKRRRPDVTFAQMEQLELDYHDIANGRLYGSLVARNQMRELLTGDNVEYAVHNPPTDTRAALRGRFVDAALNVGAQFSADWTHLTLTAPERREAILLDPFEAEPTLGFEQLMEALN